MTAPLTLPPHTLQEQQARQCLGRGRTLAYHLAGAQGRLELEPEPDALLAAGFTLETRLGGLVLEQPGPLLSVLGTCPVTVAGGEDWYWALIAAGLAREIAALLGELHPLGEQSAPPGSLTLRLTATQGASRVSSRIALAPQTLQRLLDDAPWQPRSALPWPEWPVCLPLVLAHLELTRGQLQRLAVGDLLRPTQAAFTPDGDGHLDVGGWRLGVRLVALRGPLELDILSIEELTMDPYATPDTQVYDDLALSLPERRAEPLDDLPLPFTLRCGHLRLSLKALRDLAPGMLLSVPEVTPGSATLCYGERPVAQGELVEVEGRLALQIARVDLSR